MPNFYTSLQVPSISIHDNSDRELNETRAQLGLWMDSINATRQIYRKATSVLVYQHDPGGYVDLVCVYVVLSIKWGAPSVNKVGDISVNVNRLEQSDLW